jgi:hypothetical protein
MTYDQGLRMSVWGVGVLGYVRVRRVNKAFPKAPADFNYKPKLVKK